MDQSVDTQFAHNSISSEQQQGSPTRASQTASDFIDGQLQLEADAREALPYAFDHCTQPLGPLRQSLFSCLTCNPPPATSTEPYTPAAVCYSCSIACHGEHSLVELFNRRNFTCDCGTTRLPASSPCTLRIDPATGLKGPVHSQAAAEGNTYNQNCRNRFCVCGEIYNADEEKGTMFQCLGLAQEKDGGCGEDWWHPECVIGLGRGWNKEKERAKGEAIQKPEGDEAADESDTLPSGFPQEDDFDTFICYKCVNANPWIKRYAGSQGFLPPVWADKRQFDISRAAELEEGTKRHSADYKSTESSPMDRLDDLSNPAKNGLNGTEPPPDVLPCHTLISPSASRKRAADDAELEESENHLPKQVKITTSPYHNCLPDPPSEIFSLFCKENFREQFCRCPDCYPLLKVHPHLLEEEESYEPPLSESGGEGGESVGTGSLLERGEAALSNVDRVRAIEGVMVYNHLKDKVKSFLQPFAESGQAVGAEDIKAYFEKLRGDEQDIRNAAVTGVGDGGNGGGDNRREQSGY